MCLISRPVNYYDYPNLLGTFPMRGVHQNFGILYFIELITSKTGIQMSLKRCFKKAHNILELMQTVY